MEKWLFYALISMLFAGLTSVIAKMGMKNVSGDTALVVRTSMVFILVWLNAFVFKQTGSLGKLTSRDIIFLCFSGLTTTLSWIYYYRAMKIGNVQQVALIDKGSIVVTLVLAAIFLNEKFTWYSALASMFIIAGLLILVFFKK